MLISRRHSDTDVTGVVFVKTQQLFIENIKIHLNIDTTKIHLNIDTKKIESFVLYRVRPHLGDLACYVVDCRVVELILKVIFESFMEYLYIKWMFAATPK